MSPTFPEERLNPARWAQNGLVIAPGSHPTFIHGALPGEVVRASIVKRQAKLSFARTSAVEKSSADRIASDCSAFPECGGCSFRHVSYAHELEIKRQLIRELKPLGDLTADILEIFTGEPTGYRNQTRIQWDGKNAGFFGYHLHSVVPFPEHGCKNLSDRLNTFIRQHYKSQKSPSRETTFREPGIAVDPTKAGAATFDLPGGAWKFAASGFFQANKFLILPWLNFIKDLVPDATPLSELYCGSGIIGGWVGDRAKSYSGTDVARPNIEFARENFKARGLKGSFEVMDLEREVPELKPTCIANPARAGLSPAVCDAIRANVKTLIYSSCNPATLNRDLTRLPEFSLTNCAMFDFFPRTHHVEMVIRLDRK
ncbi:MAG: class I SAM-dependent RNA methyltransferase [Leptospirales bacterium]|nr:class I SAM-dependent RNA methyltransferase [Leptospirales bacterium]